VESFEHLVKVALETENLIVAGNLKFYVQRRTRKKNKEEVQRHGYEVDLVGARSDLLVLASVKSFFGSRGVSCQGFKGLADETKKTHYELYKLFNEADIRDGVVKEAAKQFGYNEDQVELRLYVGKFQNDAASECITAHLCKTRAGRGTIKVLGLEEILQALLRVTNSKAYFNDPVVMTLKALKHAKRLVEPKIAK
jgi:hypothetical protein